MYRACELLKKGASRCRLHSQPLSSTRSSKTEDEATSSHGRLNAINIQMLSEGLHRQIFSQFNKKQQLPQETLDKIKTHLQKHDLWDRETQILPDVDFEIPKLQGENIDEHFRKLASKQTAIYRDLAAKIIQKDLPKTPSEWIYRPGWTKYLSDGSSIPVGFPEEQVTVFDIEVLVPEGHFPTMATAVSDASWYSWCSERLIKDHFSWSQKLDVQDLIPLETGAGQSSPPGGHWPDRLVIGHNVGFDRSFVKEQYYIKGPKTRFLDTMSMHIAVSGFTSFQRMLWNAKRGMKSGNVSTKKEVLEFEDRAGSGPLEYMWMDEGSMNNLNDVFQHYCKDDEIDKIDKDQRQMFVKGSMTDIRDNFQDLMIYCANDVIATWKIFKQIWPLFTERFPHPVTLAGMLEMGSTYLPVNSNWDKFISNSEFTYKDQKRELSMQMMKLANNSCELQYNERYKKSVWLWDLDWKSKENKLRKPAKKSKAKLKAEQELRQSQEETVDDRVNRVLSTEDRLYKVVPHMPGYPSWYAELCQNMKEEDWLPGPNQISSQKRVTPKLLGLCWDGYPVHYDDTLGWGYLVPGRPITEVDNLIDSDSEEREDPSDAPMFPYQELVELCPYPQEGTGIITPDITMRQRTQDNTEELSLDQKTIKNMFEVARGKNVSKAKWFRKSKNEDRPYWHEGDGPYKEVDIPGCWFFKIPHKDGLGKRVGNPLGKAYLDKIEDGTLSANSGQADRFLKLSKMCAYWHNNRDRVMGQMVVWLKQQELPDTVTGSRLYEDGYVQYGAIVPRVVSAGTVTRRAVEQTWLTASNVYEDRIGSELKAMIQSPPGYHFIGADVDSQELWIAAVLGDSYFGGIHGCTALGWMTLQGKKSQGTDLHSKTAKTVGCTRDQAKILNYGRIYGAGKLFAKRLLMQFNHRIDEKEAQSKTGVMYRMTKGVKKRQEGGEEVRQYWEGGSESQMFNQLEEIANSSCPRTPVLGCQISTALEPNHVHTEFMTSRINWVVQSSAVDYLHLMLVCMRWLMDEYDIDGRFSISIHDEVRYLVKSEDRHRAALALQISNLLTRSMFAYKIGMNDLPQSVAFFSTVDIDECLRKEVTLDCKTPSNPHGVEKGYNIPTGEALDIHEILSVTKGSLETDSHAG